MKLNSSQILIKPLTDKTIVWFKNSNTYVLVAHETAKIIKQFFKNKDNENLSDWIAKQFTLFKPESDELYKSVTDLIKKLNKSINNAAQTNIYDDNKRIFKINKLYKIDNHKIKVSYENEKLEFLIHPKFAHLEIGNLNNFNHHFKVYLNKNLIVLSVNNKIIDKWTTDEVHYFQGKFSMCLVEKIYAIKEVDWMGVFHASALSNGKKSILFTGDSGNGKSTLAALLMHKGYDMLADDFVPISAANNEVYQFPAAISIKVNALNLLAPLFPVLKTSAQFYYKTLNKTVRYLPPIIVMSKGIKHLPCKSIIQIEYKKNSDLRFEKINQETAFKNLIPDAWLSPKSKNATQFLNWFVTIPCYKLTYSDTESMYKTIKKCFEDEKKQA